MGDIRIMIKNIELYGILLLLLLILVAGINARQVRAVEEQLSPKLPSTELPTITYVSNTYTHLENIYLVNQTDTTEALFEKFDVPYQYRDFVRLLCEFENVDVDVFVSLIQIESHWGKIEGYNNMEGRMRLDGNADIGLGQLNSKYFEYFESHFYNPSLLFELGYLRGKFDPTDPYSNLQVSASYLSYLYKYFGNYEQAIQSYNAGIGNLSRGRVPASTVVYTRAIMNSWSTLCGTKG